MIPLYDSNPGRRFPVVTVALIVANFAVFLFYEIPNHDAAINQASFHPCDVTHACHLGLPWAVSWITAMFMHAGWFHILGNMLFLLIFGNNVEDAFGRRGYLAFYLGGGIAATVLQTAVTLLFGTADDAQSANLGASGAIAAVLGAYIVLYPKSRVFGLVGWIPLSVPAWFCLGLWFVLQLFAGSSARIHPDTTGGSGVASFAHIGGFIFGAVAAIVLTRAGKISAEGPPRWHENPPSTRASTASALTAPTPATTPAWSSAPQKSTKIKCIKCGHVQMELLNEATFVCEACGEKLTRKTQSAMDIP
jgi:membrane associated rhomboid family serine protease